MKVQRHLVEARRARLAALLDRHSYLPVADVCRRLGVSEATARRDLSVLAKDRRIIRTFGGAMAEFSVKFASFRERTAVGQEGKARIARMALEWIRPGMKCFFDSGTTIFAIAEELSRRPVGPLTVVTNNLPVAEVVAMIRDVTTIVLGGQFFARQSAMLGEHAIGALDAHEFDIALLGAEGMDAGGLWNSTEEIVRFQRRLVEHSRGAVFCVDATKLGRQTRHCLCPWSGVRVLLTDVPFPALPPAARKAAQQPPPPPRGGGG